MMEANLEKRWKLFQNSPDGEKLAKLIEIEESSQNKDDVDFLYMIIENERFEKIRIKAIFVLLVFEDSKVIQKLKEFYAYEREHSVRLAIVETISKMKQEGVSEFLFNVVEKDDNAVIRSIAIKELYDRTNDISQERIKKTLLDVIHNDSAYFPKQVALSIIPHYSDEDIYDSLKRVFNREKKFKMSKLLFKTLNEIAYNFGKEVDIKEPIEEEKKKRRKRRKKKEEEEYLFF